MIDFFFCIAACRFLDPCCPYLFNFFFNPAFVEVISMGILLVAKMHEVFAPWKNHGNYRSLIYVKLGVYL